MRSITSISEIVISTTENCYDLRSITKNVDVGYNISIKLDTSGAITVFLFGKKDKDV